MPIYTFRCPEGHGDFTVEQSIRETTSHYPCPGGCGPSPKVLGANIDRNSLKQNPKKTK